MASTIQTQIGVANPTVTVTDTLGTNPVQTIGISQYIPVTIDVAQADITASVIPIATQSTLTAQVAGAFDNVRVGDFITAIATGSLTGKNNVTISNCYVPSGLNYVVYPETYNSTNLGAKSGDFITEASSGTGIPSNTYITKIDYANRRIYLSANATTTTISDLTVSPRIRVTAVRKSTATSNPNQIDFDSTVATTGVAGNVTIKGGAVDGVLTVVRLTPVNDTVGSKATIVISTATLDGSAVKGSAEGFNGLAYDTLNYSNIGRYQTDLNSYRSKAGVAAPTGA